MKKLLILLCICSSFLHGILKEKVIICMVCHDIGAHIPCIRVELEKIGSIFADYRIIVYECNSEDNTPSLLYFWRKENFRLNVITEFISKESLERSCLNKMNGMPFKWELQALVLNKALFTALSNEYDDFSHVLWIDPNLSMPSLTDIYETFQVSNQWDAVFGYGIDAHGLFNDWDAFRDDRVPFGPELLGDPWYKEKRFFCLQKEDPWCPVYSAFGGCAIYRRESLIGCRYEGIITKELERYVQDVLVSNVKTQINPVKQYMESCQHVDIGIVLSSKEMYLDYPKTEQFGVYITDEPDAVMWKFHSGAFSYPAVSPHVILNLSLFTHGYKRLFINPKLVCSQKDSHYDFHPNLD